MDIAFKGQNHFAECKATAPSTLPKVGALSEAWKSKECSVLQCVLGIECCLLPVRCLVRAGTGLNATFATGASFLSSSQLRMYEHLPLHTLMSWHTRSMQFNGRLIQACCFPCPAEKKTSGLHFRSGFLEQTAFACKAS